MLQCESNSDSLLASFPKVSAVESFAVVHLYAAVMHFTIVNSATLSTVPSYDPGFFGGFASFFVLRFVLYFF